MLSRFPHQASAGTAYLPFVAGRVGNCKASGRRDGSRTPAIHNPHKKFTAHPKPFNHPQPETYPPNERP
jgi:hypothetical protein